MVDNNNIKDEEFAYLFGSAKRKKQLAAAKAEIDSLKTSQANLQSQILSNMPQSSTSISLGDATEKKPNLLFWGGVALVVVVGGILLINKK
jgi:hypothetical protein